MQEECEGGKKASAQKNSGGNGGQTEEPRTPWAL